MHTRVFNQIRLLIESDRPSLSIHISFTLFAICSHGHFNCMKYVYVCIYVAIYEVLTVALLYTYVVIYTVHCIALTLDSVITCTQYN